VSGGVGFKRGGSRHYGAGSDTPARVRSKGGWDIQRALVVRQTEEFGQEFGKEFGKGSNESLGWRNAALWLLTGLEGATGS
jgi:hypothetical protein